MDSIYQKIDKVRKPRVQISYDLEDGGQSVKKELPFVVGVMGDYSGHSAESKVPLKDRKFITIDGESFNQVMAKMCPELTIKVPNKLTDDDKDIAVDLKFSCLDDFEPDKIAEQVPALKKLLAIRSQLRDLLSKADRSEELEALLEQVIQDDGQLKQLSEQLGANADNQDNNSTDQTEEKTDE